MTAISKNRSELKQSISSVEKNQIPAKSMNDIGDIGDLFKHYG